MPYPIFDISPMGGIEAMGGEKKGNCYTSGDCEVCEYTKDDKSPNRNHWNAAPPYGYYVPTCDFKGKSKCGGKPEYDTNQCTNARDWTYVPAAQYG